MHTRALSLLLGLMVGVLVGELTVYSTEVAIVATLLLFVQGGFSSIIFLLSRRDKKEHSYGAPFYIRLSAISFIFYFSVVLGIVRTQFIEERDTFTCPSSCTFTGVILTPSEVKDGNQIFMVSKKGDKTVYHVQVKTSLYPRYRAGETLTLSGKVTKPLPVMTHGDSPSFNYATYLRARGIGSEMFYPHIKILFSENENRMLSFLYRLREYFVTTVSSYVAQPVAALSSAMLFGQSSMSKELLQTFRAAGLSHIVVLSGFNVVIIISFVLFVMRMVPFFLRIFLAALFVILFVVMVGAEASLVRATIMSCISLLALSFGRSYRASQALLLSLFIIIMYDPLQLLYSPSLHLSFLATAGIVYMSNSFEKVFQKIQSKTYKEICSTTLASYIATLPYLMYSFGTISIYSLIANVCVLPLVPVAMCLTFLVILASAVSSSVALLFGYVETLVGGYIIFIAHLIERLPSALLTVSISFFMMCFLYMVIIFFFFIFSLKKKDETLLTKSDEIVSEIISY